MTPPKQTIKRIAGEYGISMADLVGISHERWHTRARSHVAWVLRQEGRTYKQIGEYLGDRDHSTIYRLVGLYEKRLMEVR